MITEFTVVRHGETEANLDGILQGQLDTALNPRGIRQAELAARRLEEEPFDLAFSSDLRRAMETAERIAAPHRIPVRPMPALREWNLGDLQGKKWSELAQQYKEVMDAFKSETGDVAVPGGERRSDFYFRVGNALDTFPKEFPGKKILLVTHGGVLKAVFRHIVGPVSGNARLPLTSNASVSSFRHIDGFWQLVSWNDVSHLRTLGESESIVF